MTKYDIFKEKHKAAKTVTEQKSLLKAYLLGLPYDELMQFYMETPDIIEKNINAGSFIRNDNSQNLFTISSMQDVWVLANVFETDIEKIKREQHPL